MARVRAWLLSVALMGVAGWTCPVSTAPAEDPAVEAEGPGVELVGAGLLRTERRYRVLEGSGLIEDCALPCGRPARLYEVRGDLWTRPGGDCLNCPSLVQVEARLEIIEPDGDVQLDGGVKLGKGSGSWRLVSASPTGSWVAQEMRLRLSIQAADGESRVVSLSSGVVRFETPFPWIDLRLEETPDALGDLDVYSLDLLAVPWPDFWISTSRSFTSGVDGGVVSAGDLILAASPRTVNVGARGVFRNTELTAALGVQLPAPDVGLDAAALRWEPLAQDVPIGPAPLPELLFSIPQSIFSERLGRLEPSDILSARGVIAFSGAEWAKAFGLPDDGKIPNVDAVSLLEGGVPGDDGFVVSVSEGFLAPQTRERISSGDLLRSDGTIFRRERDLFKSFGLENAETLPGVDAVFVWRHGEIWFSTERGFRTAELGDIAEGDILSDTGRIVVRNRELLAEFAPRETLADFGLDALAVSDEPLFSDCGFLVEGAECVLFEGDCGGWYVISNRGEFLPGDRVRVTGKLVTSCTTTCPQGEACILGNAIEACDFDGCGRLVSGDEEGCVALQTDSGRRLLIPDPGPFQENDRVHVSGTVVRDCDSVCISPCVVIENAIVGPCRFENCGQLVELGDGCVLFEDAGGDRYVIDNVGDFAPGDDVFVTGVLAEDCVSACAPEVTAVAKGCIQDADVDSAGPIGEVGFFLRADCNADGAQDLSDAVYHLLYLFSSGAPPLCPEACNANGDESLDITDPIFTLSFLFTGGPTPPPPFPFCGEETIQISCDGIPCPCDYPDTQCP